MTDTLVTTNRNARLTLGGDDTLTVSRNGYFSTTSSANTITFSQETDGADIINDGVIGNARTGGRAIVFTSGVGSDLEATITNRASISALDDAIQITDGSVTSGIVKVTNSEKGAITSGSGQAIDFAGGRGDFVASIENRGFIGGLNSDAVKIGGIGTIANSGQINGGYYLGNAVTADGIEFEANAKGTVTNTGIGHISGDLRGIGAGAGSQITVTNAAGSTIEARNGAGIGSDSSATVVNHGTISGSLFTGLDAAGRLLSIYTSYTPNGDGDGIDIDGKATITNYGVIKGFGAAGTGADGKANVSEGISAGGGAITNETGAKITGGSIGIQVADTAGGNADFLTTIVNNGTIAGGTSFGVRIVSDFDDTLTNNGTISGGGSIAIAFGSGDNTLKLGGQSQINGTTDGGAGVDTLDLSGYGKAATVDLTKGQASGTSGVVNFESVIGSGFADSLIGDAKANTFKGGKGNDVIDGNGGTDTAVFDGDMSSYSITKIDGGYAVTGVDGTDKLFDIELLKFSNGIYNLETAFGQANEVIVNTAPKDVKTSNSAVAENVAIGTTVGLLSATDAEGDTLTYTLVDDAGGMFKLVGNKIVTAGAMDFEDASTHGITVKVSDGSLTVQKDIAISVTDVYEAPPNSAPTAITLSSQKVAENVAIGTTVGLLSATDAEGDTLSYTLVNDAGGLFKLVGNKIVTAGANDFEDASSHGITVKVSDGKLTAQKDITISVTDVYEAPANTAPTAATLAGQKIAENVAIGTTVGLLSATDAEGDTLTYTLTDDAGGLFKLVGNKIVTAGAIDFEDASSHGVTVKVSDGTVSVNKDFTISVTDVYEAPANAAPTAATLAGQKIAENVAIGTTVGLLSATDAEGDTLTYTLTDDAGGLFKLVGNKIVTAGAIDFEDASSHGVTVKVSDGALSVNKDFTISVTDVYEAPPNAAPTAVSISRQTVAENVAIGTTVGLMSATDADGDTLTYTLLNDAGGKFDLVGNKIVTAGTLDYETARSHNITVAVSDGVATVEKTIAIGVTDIFEAVANSAPTNLKLSSPYVNENVKTGTSVGLLSATDPNGDKITWSLVDNADAFKLLGNKLVTSGSIDFEKTPELHIEVKATDSFGNATFEDFTITVRDVMDHGLFA